MSNIYGNFHLMERDRRSTKVHQIKVTQIKIISNILWYLGPIIDPLSAVELFCTLSIKQAP